MGFEKRPKYYGRCENESNIYMGNAPPHLPNQLMHMHKLTWTQTYTYKNKCYELSLTTDSEKYLVHATSTEHI